MRIPSKIKPDRIRDAIVQIFFTSDLQFELLIGYFHHALTDLGYSYVSKPQTSTLADSGKSPNINQQFSVNLTHLFTNENAKLKLQLHQNKSVSFNNTAEYIGWNKYSPQLRQVLEALLTAGLIKSVKRVGIRYISEFQDIDILDKIKFGYDPSFPGLPVDSSHANLRWRDQDLNVSLNIASRIPSPGLTADNGEPVEFVSLIDVDVIRQDFEVSDVNEIGRIVDRCHVKQKEVFFSLLKEEFLKELNPVY